MRKRRLALLLLVPLSLAAYARWIEPVWIEVTRHEVQARALASPLRIAHLSDLHTHRIGKREETLLSLLEEAKPDVILITGDSMPTGGDHGAIRELLARLRAPLGKWLVRGNWEHLHAPERQREFYRAAGVRVLDNAAARIRDDVWLAGFDDLMAGAPDEAKAFAGVTPEGYRIGIFHSPEFFDRVSGQLDLALAGHTHAGQVRLPFLPPLWLPGGSGRFVEGWYEGRPEGRPEGRRGKLYVSRGIGNSRLEVRFNCRPELPIIDLRP
jgi:uncharacterized protein